MAGRVFLHELHDNENLAQIKTNSQQKSKESLAEYKGKKTNRADGSEEGRSMKTLDEILEP